MTAFELSQLLQDHTAKGERYLEFLRVPSMNLGIYQLKVGADDPQNPHEEDEVYYVLSGKAMLRVAEEIQPVQAGSIVFVGKGVPHKFVEIAEELTVLVFFAANG